MAHQHGAATSGTFRTIENTRRLLCMVHRESFAEFTKECNLEHERLLNDEPESRLNWERRAYAEAVIQVCLPHPALPMYPLRDAFIASFSELRLDIRFDDLVASLAEIPVSESGNQRIRAVEYATSDLILADRELAANRLSVGAGTSPLKMVQVLERIFSSATTWRVPKRTSRADSLGPHPDHPNLALGSFADLAVQLHPAHRAASLLAYCLLRFVHMSDVAQRQKSFAGLSEGEMHAQAQAYADSAIWLAPKLRVLLASAREPYGPPKWIRSRSTKRLHDLEALLESFELGQTPTEHEDRAIRLRAYKAVEIAKSRKTLFDEILFLHRPVGPPPERDMRPEVDARVKLVRRVCAEV